MKQFLAYVVLLALLPCQALAQESDTWDWKITPYLWTVGIDGTATIGEVEQDMDIGFSDILSDFEIGGSLFAEVGKGNHSAHFDYTYIRLRPDPNTLPTPPFPADSTLATKLTISIFEPAYNYRFGGVDGNYALVLGARYLDIKMRMTPDIVVPEPFPELPIEGPDPLEAGPSWWDYFVGIKTHHQISTNWDFDFYGTIGGGDSDSPWTLQAMFGRRFSNDNRLGLGLRVWGLDYSNREGPMGQYAAIDATFYGLMIGYEFN
jgi:hypothetical protein